MQISNNERVERMIKKIMLSVAMLCVCTLMARAAPIGINGFALVINGVPNSEANDLASSYCCDTAYNLQTRDGHLWGNGDHC